MKQSKLLIVFIVAAVLAASCIDMNKIIVNSPDLSKVADGTYRGNSRVGPVQVTLDVKIENRTMLSIVIIRHFNGRGKKAEVIIPRVIEAQSLDVDVISGATGSSKAILKAIENALTQQ